MADRRIVERYVGLPYVPGVFDCADLAMRVAREVYGVEVRLPQDRPHPVEPRGMIRAIESLCATVAAPRAAGEAPQDGDGLLLATGSGARPTHIGIVCLLGGEAWALHNDDVFRASVLTRLRDLPAAGWRLHGVYRWLPER